MEVGASSLLEELACVRSPELAPPAHAHRAREAASTQESQRTHDELVHGRLHEGVESAFAAFGPHSRFVRGGWRRGRGCDRDGDSSGVKPEKGGNGRAVRRVSHSCRCSGCGRAASSWRGGAHAACWHRPSHAGVRLGIRPLLMAAAAQQQPGGRRTPSGRPAAGPAALAMRAWGVAASQASVLGSRGPVRVRSVRCGAEAWRVSRWRCTHLPLRRARGGGTSFTPRVSWRRL